MSLRSEPILPVPEETARIARAAFPKGNLYLKMRDEIGTFYKDTDFIELFSTRGQPAFSPWRLALITIMQFAEGLSDRQAAEAVRARIDWKYALSLDLADAGFDFSILSEFRRRLLNNKLESVLLDHMLLTFREKGLLKVRGTQRTDSTHILANVRHLNRLETVAETLRATLNDIAKVAPEWLYVRVTADWFEQYSRRIEEYRLPKGEKARNDHGALVGLQTLRLLELLKAEDTPAELMNLRTVKALQSMWEQQFAIKDGKLRFRSAADLAPTGERFDSPYDVEARYGNKRSTMWRGYKTHYTETCDRDCPFLICNVETTTANIPDIVMGEQIHHSLREKDLTPDTHLLDSGYIEAKWIVQSANVENIKVIGPVRPNNQWQSKSGNGFALSDFSIDWKNKRVTCPAGQTTANWYQRKLHGAENIRVRFKRSQCSNCQYRTLCTRSARDGRSLGFAGEENHRVLEQVREIQNQAAWQKLYHQRAGIEGTFSQAVRSFGLRRSRYIGERKTHLHNLATAAAINIARSVNWLNDKPREKTRISWFARLKTLEI